MCLRLQVQKRDTFVIARNALTIIFGRDTKIAKKVSRVSRHCGFALFLKLFIVLRKFMARSPQRIVWIILRENI